MLTQSRSDRMRTRKRTHTLGVLMRTGLFTLAALVLSVAPGLGAVSKPNIVLILADDLGAECLSCYNGTSYRTPNLDRLAQTGIRFANCYATPLCSPSRVQLMTGRYGFRTGWTNLIGRATPKFYDPKEKTFAHMLNAAGYATAIAGKWQLADFKQHPDNVKQCGFDEYCCWTWVFDGTKTSRYWKPSLWQNGKLRDDVADRYGEDVFCDFLIDFVTRKSDRPFFVYYPMALVHAPFEPTPDSRKAGQAGRGKNNFPDMVAYMDRTVGRLVAALDKLGLRENTLVLFAGDNGTPREITSKADTLEIRGGKGTVTHFGAHVPLIANWKGTTPAGKVLKDLIDFSDMVPTLADLTGAERAKDVTVDGRSFAPQLRGQTGNPREWIFVQLGPQRFLRDSRWLLHSDGRLYDIQSDPSEAKDLAGSDQEEVNSARKRLGALLGRLR